jgi:hypothetical protein
MVSLLASVLALFLAACFSSGVLVSCPDEEDAFLVSSLPLCD